MPVSQNPNSNCSFHLNMQKILNSLQLCREGIHKPLSLPCAVLKAVTTFRISPPHSSSSYLQVATLGCRESGLNPSMLCFCNPSANHLSRAICRAWVTPLGPEPGHGVFSKDPAGHKSSSLFCRLKTPQETLEICHRFYVHFITFPSLSFLCMCVLKHTWYLGGTNRRIATNSGSAWSM